MNNSFTNSEKLKQGEKIYELISNMQNITSLNFIVEEKFELRKIIKSLEQNKNIKFLRISGEIKKLSSKI
jgi:hypothetical protein